MKSQKLISCILIIFLCIESAAFSAPQKTCAAAKYITRLEVLKKILDELDVAYEPSQDGVVKAAKEVGLLTEYTFRNYSINATKADMSILLVRADEYLYGSKVSESLLEEIMQKRISDLSGLSKAVQPYLAKSYALGYIKGNNNGIYSSDRTFHPRYRVSYAYATQLIEMIKDKSQRHSIAPDGQLIRTSNLPKYAEFYPYILATFPNEYYDWDFLYMLYRDPITEELLYYNNRLENLEDYAAPKDILKYKEGTPLYHTYTNDYEDKVTASHIYNQNKILWEQNTKRYLELILNFDYRKIDSTSEWMKELEKVAIAPDDPNANYYRKRIENYINKAIENKIIVISKFIGVDKSSEYIADDNFYIRAHVRYKFISCKNMDESVYSSLLFTDYPFPNYSNIKLNVWHDSYINIDLNTSRQNACIDQAIINDAFHVMRIK